MKVWQEFKDNGAHRVCRSSKVKGDLTKDAPTQYGAWAPYAGIARSGPYYGTTDYYDGVLPRLFKVTEIE